MAEVWQMLFSPVGFVLLLASVGLVILKFALRPHWLRMFTGKYYTEGRDANDAKLREVMDVCRKHKHSSIEAEEISESKKKF